MSRYGDFKRSKSVAYNTDPDHKKEIKYGIFNTLKLSLLTIVKNRKFIDKRLHI